MPPKGKGIRVDTHCFPGYLIPPYYDSLLAKVITFGADRSEAIEHMQSALKDFVITGVDTTIPFLKFLLNDPNYLNGKVSTRWVEEYIEKFLEDK